MANPSAGEGGRNRDARAGTVGEGREAGEEMSGDAVASGCQ